MNTKQGFVQFPIIVIVIIIAVAIMGSGSYYGYKQYQKHQNTESLNQATKEAESAKLEKLIQEIEALKKNNIKKNDKLSAPVVIPKEKPPVEPVKQNKILSGEEVFAKISPAVVSVKSANDISGSGMIIEKEGIILTNAHVVEGVSSATIRLADKRSFSSLVIGRDEIIDLALLRILSGDAKFPIVELGDSDALKGGAKLYAFGYPLGLSNVVFTGGVFSARQEIDDINYIQTDAPIHGGNSGGPLVNDQGQAVGVNTLAAKIKGNISGVGLGFALPANLARAIIPDLRNGKDIILSKQSTPSTPVSVPIVSPSPKTYSSYEKNDYDGFERELNSLISGVVAAMQAYNKSVSSYSVGSHYAALDYIDEALRNINSTKSSSVYNLQNYFGRLSQHNLPFYSSIADTHNLSKELVANFSAMADSMQSRVRVKMKEDYYAAYNISLDQQRYSDQYDLTLEKLTRATKELYLKSDEYFGQ